MPRLIDADKLKNHYAWWENGTAEMTLAEAKLNFDIIIDVQPTVDAEPVRHGRWIEEIGMLLCSECGDSWGTETEQMIRSFNYCPNCGAKMDEVEDAKDR